MRDERQQLGLSQEKFAERCDVHPTYVGKIERGEKNVSAENLLKLAHGIGVKVSELFRRSGF